MQNLRQILEQILINAEDDEQLVYALTQLVQYLNEKDNPIKPLDWRFLQSLMWFMIEDKWDDVKKMEEKLEKFLEKGPVEYRKSFATDLGIITRRCALYLQIINSLQDAFEGLLTDRFVRRVEVSEILQKLEMLESRINALEKAFNEKFN